MVKLRSFASLYWTFIVTACGRGAVPVPKKRRYQPPVIRSKSEPGSSSSSGSSDLAEEVIPPEAVDTAQDNLRKLRHSASNVSLNALMLQDNLSSSAAIDARKLLDEVLRALHTTKELELPNDFGPAKHPKIETHLPLEPTVEAFESWVDLLSSVKDIVKKLIGACPPAMTLQELLEGPANGRELLCACIKLVLRCKEDTQLSSVQTDFSHFCSLDKLVTRLLATQEEVDDAVTTLSEMIGFVQNMSTKPLVPEYDTVISDLPKSYTNDHNSLIPSMQEYVVNSLQRSIEAAIPEIITEQCRDLQEKKKGYAALRDRIGCLIKKLQPDSNPAKIAPKVDPPDKVQSPSKPKDPDVPRRSTHRNEGSREIDARLSELLQQDFWHN